MAKRRLGKLTTKTKKNRKYDQNSWHQKKSTNYVSIEMKIRIALVPVYSQSILATHSGKSPQQKETK
jgi:hypothetical protein